MSGAIILAIDTSTGPSSVAVLKRHKVVAYLEQTAAAMQSATLMPMIEKALKQSQVAYTELSAVACTIGPGSFTGLRVGLAAARGICFAAKLPGLGFSTLEVLAFAARQEVSQLPVLSILNAGKGECYWQGFDAGGKALSSVRVGSLSAATAELPPPAAAVGNLGKIPGYTMASATFPRADMLALLAAESCAPAALAPLYIRAPDAKLPVKMMTI